MQACAALLVAGCSTHLMPAASSPAPIDVKEALPCKAGAARVDITPAPGVSTFGHGPDAVVASGYWTRLYCRAFVLEVEGGSRVVIVPCDLSAVGTLLQREVAGRIEDIVPASRLVITATHTHAGPAHYFEGTAYTGIASTQLPGYDPQMTELLADQIAGAVREAHKNRVAARVRWVRGQMWGISRNRSLAAYQLNQPPFRFAGPVPSQLPVDQQAVDPAIHTLEIETEPTPARPTPTPIGWLTFLAVHPTVLKHSNRLLGADLFGVVSRVVEAELRRSSPSTPTADPLHGVINTNEGDMAVVAATRSTPATIHLGRALAGQILSAHAQASAVDWRNRIVLGSRYLEVDLPHHYLRDPRYRLAGKAELGLGSVFGASDHPTSIPIPVDEVVTTDPLRTDLQAPKRKFMGCLQDAFIKAGSFPRRVPLTLVRVDDTWMSFVPAELTITAGNRINYAVANIAGPSSHAVVGGLANGYLQYVTTWEEYQLQAYEGASNLYGPATGALLIETFETLARSLLGEDISASIAKGPQLEQATAFEYELGPERERLQTGAGQPTVTELGAQRQPRWVCHVANASPPAMCFAWLDAAPGRVPLVPGPWIQLVREEPPGAPVSVEGAPVDDLGLAFRTKVHESIGDAWVWTTLFTPSAEEWTAVQQAGRVRLEARQPQPDASIVSPTFTSQDLGAACTVEQLRKCGAR
jgi:neutral ceramidase